MFPSLKPGEELWIEKIPSSQVHAGDIIMVQISGAFSVTHRVVRVLRVNGQTAFLTKGDNRFLFDPLVLPESLLGRVHKAGNRDLARGFWRWIGRFIARLSYEQAIFYHRFCCNPWLDRFQRRVLSPVRRWFRPQKEMSAAVRWSPRSGIGIWYRCGLEIPVPADIAPMTLLWNNLFSSRQTSEERLKRNVLCHLDHPNRLWLVVRNRGKMMGWAWGAVSKADVVHPESLLVGTIGFLAVRPNQADAETAGRLLLREFLAWFEKRGVSSILLGPLPAPGPPDRILLDVPTSCAALLGFTPAWRMWEMLARQDSYLFRPGSCPRELNVRRWRSADRGTFLNEFHAEGFNLERFSKHLQSEDHLDGIWVAEWNGQPVGLCQGLPDWKMAHYRDIGWVWAIAQPGNPRGYVFNLIVDRRFRGRGVGPVLFDQTVQALFQAGCVEILGWTARPQFYKRWFGFVEQGSFWMMSRVKEGGR